ncbi:glycine dehydrogenase subunit 2 [Dethiosulfovibrio peptidovorans DSM 11002]|uniref:glycine dehydrogenase (aminomethyl-transferring) n=1 Tax=Dethiosulfovibrio peptidovorans DSM 11002 TaxID=469381 RepID=D2Z8V8_9BACT|nr:aminomethyl-transferring glycine dehydrogenase subunit GcvPB [Dethiosulfovibrio peptidovorans]EFC91905.1 glycine dehydrogenase subunit 2 [Dethiosulfovibrio peptidovorans DSM 11002]
MNKTAMIRRFHQASWDEPIIFDLSEPGQRGVLVPEAGPKIEESVGDGLSAIPESMRRSDIPLLPEMGQPQVLRHFNHLAQENLGADYNVDIGQGTCTMKYSPKVNEIFATSSKIADLHPYQDESTVQGALEVMYRLGECFKEISGLDCFSLQPGGGSHGALAMATVVRSYFRDRGEEDRRDEVITTFFSHPADAAVPIVKGFKVVVLPPDKDGLPDFEAFKAALSDRTAAIFFTNPEDTGIFNGRIKDFTGLARKFGALCCYDQANANGLLGIARAKEADFDLSFFNLHKTFSSPHGCGGPATGLVAARQFLGTYLPAPLVVKKGDRFSLDWDMPKSCGKIKAFYGTLPVIVRAYAWIMSLGAEGLNEASRVAILNNNYVMKKLLSIKGCSISFPDHAPRIEQARYSWRKLKEDTGFGTEDVQRRIADFGTHYWSSHEPWVIPEPFTVEPSESYSKADLDEFCAILERISQECYDDPDTIRHAPHNSTIHHVDHDVLDDPDLWAITWRSYKKKYDGYFERRKD